ncbi:MAG: SagB/ThcOx family dehydrogenase [Mangrovibacterium sp.]
MKQFCLIMLVLGPVGFLQGQQPVRLNEPDRQRGLSVMEAFSSRASVREWSPEKLSLQDLSDLLWAANGINRPEEGKRTAPSAMNAQDVDIYLFSADGIFFYDATQHLLNPVLGEDHRNVFGRQEAPVVLLLVSDISRFRAGDEKLKLSWAAMDAGIVSQNVALFCAGTGLCTRPRASMDKDRLCQILSLVPSQHPMLNLPVGYPKP